MCIFKNYSNIFKQPDDGIYSYKIYNLVIAEFILITLITLIVSNIFKMPFALTSIGVIIITEITYYLFGINTNVGKYLNLNCN